MQQLNDTELHEAVRYKWLTLESLGDDCDIMTRANSVIALEELYRKYHIKIAPEKHRMLNEEKKKIAEILKQTIEKKKMILNNMISQKNELKAKTDEERKRKISEEEYSKLSRTKQIFGNEFS